MCNAQIYNHSSRDQYTQCVCVCVCVCVVCGVCVCTWYVCVHVRARMRCVCVCVCVCVWGGTPGIYPPYRSSQDHFLLNSVLIYQTTLRLEGIIVPSKRPVPRPGLVTTHSSEQDSEGEYESTDGTTSGEASSLSQQRTPPPEGGESQSGMEEDPIPSRRKETATGREGVTHQTGVLQSNSSEIAAKGSTAVDARDHMEAAEVEAGHEGMVQCLCVLLEMQDIGD